MALSNLHDAWARFSVVVCGSCISVALVDGPREALCTFLVVSAMAELIFVYASDQSEQRRPEQDDQAPPGMTAAPPTISMHPVTLSFSDRSLENNYAMRGFQTSYPTVTAFCIISMRRPRLARPAAKPPVR